MSDEENEDTPPPVVINDDEARDSGGRPRSVDQRPIATVPTPDDARVRPPQGATLATDTTVVVVGPDGSSQAIDVNPGGSAQQSEVIRAPVSSGRGGAQVLSPAPQLVTLGGQGTSRVVIQAPPKAAPRREARRKVDRRPAVRPLSLREYEDIGEGEAIKAQAEHESGGPLRHQWGQILIGEACTLAGILVSKPTLVYAKPKQLRVTSLHAPGATFKLAEIPPEDFGEELPLIDAAEFLGIQGDARTGRFETAAYTITAEGEGGAAEPFPVEVEEGDAVSILWEAVSNRRCVHFVCLVTAE